MSTAPTTAPPSAGAPPPPAPAGDVDPLVGTVLQERYRVLQRLGEGGMGTVYLAEHTTINKKLALKVLSGEYANKKDLVDRFLQEARAASMIPQENVVEITDFGSIPGGSVFFVMEYLKGEDLSQTIESLGALPWARVQPIVLQICRALQAAHEAGIIHRDMKPENCYRIKRGKNADFIKVLDFGIAKVTSEEGEGGKGLTRTGMIFGTPEYMSPEQARGDRPDHRVDVYAVGVIMYELLTGRVPFTADTFMGILTKHMFDVPEAPSTVAPHANIPPEVEAIIQKAMQKDRELRFQDMAEMHAAIEAVGSGAAAVSVIEEHVARPTEGHMSFTHHPTTGPFPPVEAAPSSNNLVLKIGGAIVGVVAIAAVLSYMAQTPPEQPEDTAAAVAPAPPAEPTPAPELEPEVKPEPEPVADTPPAPVEVPKVAVKFDTGTVEASIVDARDGAVLGSTADAEGLSFTKSEEGLALILRAPGYVDEEITVIPDREGKMVRRKLTKVRKRVRKPTRNTKPSPPPTKTKPKTRTKPTRATSRSKRNQDLKNPFGN